MYSSSSLVQRNQPNFKEFATKEKLVRILFTMNKIITILEAGVSQEKWDTLRKAYGAIKEKRPQPMPLQSFLLQKRENPKLWQIVSVWEDMKVLQKMKSSGETPAGILVFREAGAEPTLSIFEAKEEI